MAEFERALIRERTLSGLAAARAEGRTGANSACAAAVDPHKDAEPIRCGSTLKAAESISMIRCPGSWPEIETRARAKVADMSRPVTDRSSETVTMSYGVSSRFAGGLSRHVCNRPLSVTQSSRHSCRANALRVLSLKPVALTDARIARLEVTSRPCNTGEFSNP